MERANRNAQDLRIDVDPRLQWARLPCRSAKGHAVSAHDMCLPLGREDARTMLHRPELLIIVIYSELVYVTLLMHTLIRPDEDSQATTH